MKRWRRPHDEDDDFSYDLFGDGEEAPAEEKPGRTRRPPPPPARPLRVTRFDDFDADEDEDDEETFELLEDKIRAGKYKPRKADPWTAHVLYQNLKALGEI